MAALKVYYDAEGRTLTVRFDDPEKEHRADETGEEVILIRDRNGRVIGFERWNYSLRAGEPLAVGAVAI